MIKGRLLTAHFVGCLRVSDTAECCLTTGESLENVVSLHWNNWCRPSYDFFFCLCRQMHLLNYIKSFLLLSACAFISVDNWVSHFAEKKYKEETYRLKFNREEKFSIKYFSFESTEYLYSKLTIFAHFFHYFSHIITSTVLDSSYAKHRPDDWRDCHNLFGIAIYNILKSTANR